MNCKEFKIEFEETRVLSETATLHLGECPNCKVLHFELTQVWRMMEALPLVEAPGDFDFRLKARMATAKPGDLQPRWWYALRYVLPVFAAALVLTLVLASQNFFITSPEFVQNPNENQEKSVEIPQPPVAAPENDFAAADSGLEKIEDSTAAEPKVVKATSDTPKKESVVLASKTPDKSEATRKEIRENEGGGSRDSTLGSPQVINPPGIPNTNPQTVENPAGVIEIKPIPVEAILSEIGIETVLENGKRKVKSVRENSPAQRSGLQIGDEIVAIDDSKLDKPIQSAAIKVKVLTVTRSGETMQIPLSSEPK